MAPSTSNNPTTSTTLTVIASGLAATSNPGSRPDNPGDPIPAAALAYAIETRVLASLALAVVMAQMGQGIALDGSEEDKVCEVEYTGVMQGLRAVARIMSTGFEKACEAVLNVINDSLERVIQCDRHFIEGASSTLMKWIWAVQPAVDGLGCPGMAQIHLQSDARWDGMKIVWEILDPYSRGDADAPQTDPLQDIIIRAFTAAWGPTELAVITVHEQLAPLVDEYVHPGQESFPLGSLQCDLRLCSGDTQHGPGPSSCADPGCAGNLGSPAGHSCRSPLTSSSDWASCPAGSTNRGSGC